MDQALDKLFESTAKTRLLKLFFMNPEGQFTMEDIIKQTQLKRPAVRKELAKFMRLKLVKTKIVNIPDVKVKRLKKKKFASKKRRPRPKRKTASSRKKRRR
ncbi:MAG: hypothetical protein HYW88_02935 [Candidatus Sungbacteria bacterium]|nr:hypothetical protein [Candidatus Sungbacteria bacterium]